MIFNVSVSHNAPQVARDLSDLAGRIERVPEEAMPEAVGVLGEAVTVEIDRMAGGVYWDVESDVSFVSGGARGEVWTDRSKPHRIEPTKPHGLLVFEKGGETVFVKGGVDHPGSPPVNWVPGVVSARGRIRGVFSSAMERAVSGSRNLAAPVGGL